MRLLPFAAIAVLALGVVPAPRAEEASSARQRRTYDTAHAGPRPPRLDGIPDDVCWQRVEWTSDFVQWEPTEGVPPTYQTAFKILYDGRALYIAYRCHDGEPARIERQLGRRDRFSGDWVEINIDSYFDHRTAYSFTASVSGSRGDEFVSDDGENWDSSWDPIWKVATHIDGEGWTAEVEIPLSQLRFVDRDEQVWGIQVQRRLFRKEERSLWQAKSKEERGWVSRFGELRGLRGLRPPRQVELLPYAVARAESFEEEPGNPFRTGRNSDFELGLDGKAGVSSNLTLDFTVNPDFGQVEADPSEVNLTAFETRFTEKRPFFIEGRSILDFQLSPAIAGGDFTIDNLFYSRRIGRPPRGDPELAAGESADVPATSSILFASKLTGQTRRGLSIGVLESVTGEETARIAATGGARREEAVEPLTNFFAGRLQQDLRGGASRLGGMLTAAHRRLDGTPLGFLHRSAWAGGADFYHSWRNRSWYVAGNGVASRVAGDREALLATQTASTRYFQRPDNDHTELDSTRTALAGHAGALRLGKTGGKRWRFEGGVTWRSPGFEANDLGFLRRADEINQFGWAQYGIRNPFSIFRRLSVNFNEWIRWDFGGANLLQQANLNCEAAFLNNWGCGAGATRAWRRVSNSLSRGGPSMRLPGQWSNWAWIASDSRRALGAELSADFTDNDADNVTFRRTSVDVVWRPSNALQLSLSPSYSRLEDELQYVTTADRAGEPRYLFGTIDQRTAALTFRVDYTLRPNLTVQYYGAPFVSAGTYDRLKRLTEPHAPAYRDRFQVFEPGEIASTEAGYAVDEDRDGTPDYDFENPNFDFREFNSNLVMRWEYQPGSLLYLVWSQARTGAVANGALSLRDDLDALFDVHPRDVFLVKLSKWFSL